MRFNHQDQLTTVLNIVQANGFKIPVKNIRLSCKAFRTNSDFFPTEILLSHGDFYNVSPKILENMTTLLYVFSHGAEFPEDLMSTCTNLRNLHLYFRSSESNQEWTGLKHLRQLKQLTIEKCRGVHALNPVKYLMHLRHLEIHTCPDINTLEPINHLWQLKCLVITECPRIKCMRPIDGLMHLEHLEVIACQ